eukprot:1141700-Pelagomonas_calceolata.AAC.8
MAGSPAGPGVVLGVVFSESQRKGWFRPLFIVTCIAPPTCQDMHCASVEISLDAFFGCQILKGCHPGSMIVLYHLRQ